MVQPLQHRLMPDGAVFPDAQGIAHIGVQNTVFLNVAAHTDGNHFVVAPQGTTEPDRRAATQGDLADHIGIRRDPEIPVLGRDGGETVQRV